MAHRRMRIVAVVVVGVIMVAAVGIGLSLWGPRWLGNDVPGPADGNPPPDGNPDCTGSAACLQDAVGNIVDGDTLDVGDVRVRLVLVDAPEVGESGYQGAKDLLAQTCPVGSTARVDEDDWQSGGDQYGRMLAVVYCGGKNANAVLIASPWATTYTFYCSSSEFGSEAWSGCSSPPPPPPPPPEENCDPAYPTVCIPPPPPDLDCADIAYRNFQVLPPDPHRFDGDGDGIGCEA